VPIGMAVGRIDSVRHVSEIFSEIVTEAQRTLDALARLR